MAWRLAITAVGSSPVRCRSRATFLVALVTFDAVCDAHIPRRVVTDVKSCETELANCQALPGAVRAKEAKDVVPLAAITPSKSTGARSQ
jgi:hypothetical protein